MWTGEQAAVERLWPRGVPAQCSARGSWHWLSTITAAAAPTRRRIAEVAEAEGHHPDLHLEGYNCVVAELTTHAIGGLSENDFIVAAKINELETADLQPRRKQKFWA